MKDAVFGGATATVRGIGVVLALAMVVIVLPATPVAGAADVRWAWPMAAPHYVVRPFIAPEHAYASGHRGIDIGGSVGDLVRSPAAGVVHFAGWVVDRPVVSIRHPGGLISSFEPVTSSLIEGTWVASGQLIGLLEEGHGASTCLHFGVRRHGEYVSPLLYLGGIPRSVLLPTRALE